MKLSLFLFFYLLAVSFAKSELTLADAARKVDAFMATESFGGIKLSKKYHVRRRELTSPGEAPDAGRTWRGILARIDEPQGQSVKASKDGKAFVLVIVLESTGEASLEFGGWKKFERARRVPSPPEQQKSRGAQPPDPFQI